MITRVQQSGYFAWRLVLTVILACVVLVVPQIAMLVSAQSGTSDISIVTTQSGSPFYTACYVLVGFSNEGCDQNQEGEVTFDDIPYGTYTLRQTSELGLGRSIPDSSIAVTGASDADGRERIYVSVQSEDGAYIGTSPQVAIFTTENGEPVYDACYVLVGYSHEGCDENRDGKVTFDDIPWGTYTVRQTADLGAGRSVSDFTIEVRGNVSSAGWEGFSASVVTVAAPEAHPIDIALITRDPANGHLLTDVCYVLVGYGNEGCDENGDGQVTFADIPPGTYTVRQTRTPAGYPAVNDHQIKVAPLGELPGGEVFDIPLGFIVRQAPEQNASETLNVSVIMIDYPSGQKITTDVCVELVGASNIGCDEDLRDGQIDFLDVPAGGPYELRFSNVPSGWQIGDGPANPYRLWIQPETWSETNVFVFVLINKDAGQSVDPAVTQTYDHMVGEWYGKRRDVELRADGTGEIRYSLDISGSGIDYQLKVNEGTSPVTATITAAQPRGNFDPTSYPGVGDVVSLRLEAFPEGTVLVAEMGGGFELWVCPNLDGTFPNIGNVCY